mmetsp:Transcript_49208/g.157362  ORF Transcript_49208/g.157362 Transcript_49208/m.157362 type:complete len:402 (+) Transcript_49208:62-1267(+)
MSAAEVAVKITAQVEVAFGEDILICGSTPALGSWHVAGAAPMTWGKGDYWTAELALPCGVRVELKVLIRNHSGVRWVGVGANQAENVVLETGLGRAGGQGSRFVTTDTLPFGLIVEDIALSKPAAAGGDGCSEGRGSGDSTAGQTKSCDAGVVAQAAPAAPASAGMACGGSEVAQPAPHVAAAMLAGGAAGHGQAVTYATTTTTTTVVTINGTEVGAMAGHAYPVNPQLSTHAHGGAPAPAGGQGPMAAGRPALTCGRGPGPAALEDEAQQGSAVDACKAAGVAAARAQNAGVPRLGCVPLAWRQGEPKEVRVVGSWDGWAGQLALEPLPKGGFGVLLALLPGEYECKFVVDGQWCTSEELEVRGQHKNNVICASDTLLVPVPPAGASPASEPGLALALPA